MCGFGVYITALKVRALSTYIFAKQFALIGSSSQSINIIITIELHLKCVFFFFGSHNNSLWVKTNWTQHVAAWHIAHVSSIAHRCRVCRVCWPIYIFNDVRFYWSHLRWSTDSLKYLILVFRMCVAAVDWSTVLRAYFTHFSYFHTWNTQFNWESWCVRSNCCVSLMATFQSKTKKKKLRRHSAFTSIF